MSFAGGDMGEMTGTVSARRYRGRGDLTDLLVFASASFAARPGFSAWHPGDLVWQLRDRLDTDNPIRLWSVNGTVAAAAAFMGADAVWFEALPEAEGLVPEIVGWAEAAGRTAGVSRLAIRAFGRDKVRSASLSALGYERAGPESVHFERDLSLPIEPPSVPAGYAVRDCRAVDAEARAAVHRAAWSDLSRIGIENVRSTFSAATYETIRRAPVYDPALDLVVTDQAGRMAACCIAWADPASGIGVFEPMGTDPAARGLRLAALLIAEGCKRLRDSGHALARISTAHFNTPARNAYDRSFAHVDTSYWWTRTLS